MKRKPVVPCLGGVLSILLGASCAFAEVSLGSYTATGSVEAGAYPQPVPYTDIAKFQEYRDIAQQVIVPRLQLLLGDKEENYYARFDATNVAQRNEIYTLRFGEYGLLDVQARWAEIPHFLSDDIARTPYQQSGGNFTLFSRPPPPTPGQAPGGNIGNWVESTQHPLDLSILRGIANLDIRYTPDPQWTYTTYFNFQNPSGSQALGTLFGPSPGVYNISEILQPIEYDIYNYGAGVEYGRDGWLVGLKYEGSFFRNQFDTVTWQNPDTWNNPKIASGACANTAAYSPSGGLGPCAGISAMYPDNEAHNLTLNLGLTLPWNTHLMAGASYGWWLQDSPFIPFTSNSALPSQALPRASLGGDVQPAFVNATVTSNPIEKLDLKGTYSYFNYDNQTPAITFSNVTSLNDVANLWNATAYPFSFSNQDINLESSYSLTEQLAARFVADISTYHNSGLMVLQQDQTSYGPILDYTPNTWLEMRASYQHAFRDSPGYENNRSSLLRNAAASELAAVRRFDEASVEVNQTALYTQVTPRKDLTLFAELDYDDNFFPASDIGLSHWSDYSPSVGLAYNPFRNLNFFADYSWEADDWNLNSFQRQPGTAGGPNCSPIASAQTPSTCPGRRWSSLGRDQGSSVDFGFDLTIPEEWMFGHASNLRVQDTYATGSNVIHAHGDVVTPATNFPSVNSEFHELIVNYQYMIRKSTWLNIGYYFSHFGENDFAFDNLTPWMGSASPYSIFLGESQWQPYNANVGYVTLKVAF